VNRREFIAGGGGMALAMPLAAHAQQTGRVPIVAFVHAVNAPVEMAYYFPARAGFCARLARFRLDRGAYDRYRTAVGGRPTATRAGHVCRPG
jgi:hypothetical protein